MSDDPLTPDQRDGALGAVVAALAASGDFELMQLSVALRRGGDLTAAWDEYDCVIVSLAVPPGLPLQKIDELEGRVFDPVSRAVATCGHHVRRVRITLALARTGWREVPMIELPMRFAGRFEREVDPLRHGGFGVIYRARDHLTDTLVALKVLRISDTEVDVVREQNYLRFRREMQLMMDLHHPNLMEVIWVGEEESGLHWYAMPLAECNLGERLQEFPSDPNRILSVLSSICDGVIYLHDQDVVHRDLSPENVLCMPDGSWVVSDLGLAFDLDRELTQLTTTGMSMGRVGYRPPDAEAQMAKNATPSWDIYSLGQLLEDMAQGKRFSERNGSISDSIFRPAIVRACNPEPSRRYKSVREFLDDCRKLVELTTSWEGPEERINRVTNSLRNGDVEVVRQIAAEIGHGGNIETYVSAICSMSKEAVNDLAQKSPEDLRTLTVAIIEKMPGPWPQFTQLDPMADYVVASAEALEDDSVSERALIWVLETGAEYDRWYVQGVADKYLHRLAGASLNVVARSLKNVDPRAIPSDLDWLNPAARPQRIENDES
jgi:serine/threonine protein kinase